MKIKVILAIFLIHSIFSCKEAGLPINEQYPELSESETLFKEAFEKENVEKKEYFTRSAVLLETVIKRQNLNNGYIYYNLGNTWFNAGQLGKSILNYRKAEKRLPSNMNIKNNLEYARSKVPDNTLAPDKNILIRTLFFIHYDFSFQNRMIVLIIFAFIISSSAIILLYKKNKLLKNVLWSFSILSVFLLTSIIIDSFSKREGVVIIPEVIARKGDSNGYESSFTSPLHEGVEFKLMEERNGWYYIQLPDDRQCWIPERAASLID